MLIGTEERAKEDLKLFVNDKSPESFNQFIETGEIGLSLLVDLSVLLWFRDCPKEITSEMFCKLLDVYAYVRMKAA